ncbi:MAG: hypothetical protein ACFE0J_26200 [Elainellaceae cyanobacterium]
MNRQPVCLATIVGVTLLTLGATVGIDSIAQSAVAEENEPNDTFENRETQPADVTIVTGELTQRFDPSDFDYEFSGMMSPGEASTFAIDDLDASEPFYAWIDNGSDGPDTVIGTFNAAGELIGTDDDSSPSGNGVASGIGGTAGDDGMVRLAVTGFPDFEFQALNSNGALVHEQSGEYQVRVKTGIDAPEGDVDYYSISGIDPGTGFTLEVTDANFDSILVWLDDDGNVVTVDDDGGTELLSKIRGFVPLSGSINFAISAFGDPEFTGNHIESGPYSISVELTGE